MPEIQRIELERQNDSGVEVKKGEHPALEDGSRRPPDQPESAEEKRRRREQEERDRATTPFPGG
jgi:hypothetical protein